MATHPAKLNDKDAPGPGPREQLAQWANNQDSWVRLVVSLVMASARPVTEAEVEQIYQHLLIEKRLLADDFREVDPLVVDSGLEEYSEALQLSRLSQLENVNALAEDQQLDFGESLTVLFGQNASGKTGYARVIKRMANVRTAEEVLGNAHIPSGNTEPSALVSYEVDGKPSTVTWQNELGLAPLNRVSVFDSPAVALHVNSELGYTFTPAELNLFRLTNKAIKTIQERLRSEANEHDGSVGRSLLASFKRGSAVFPLIETLAAVPEIDDLRSLAVLSDDEIALEAQLRQDIATLESGARDAVLNEAKLQLDAATVTRKAISTAVKFDVAAFNSGLDRVAGAVTAAEAARASLAGDPSLPDELDDEWQHFIGAADSYQRHLGHDEYPVDDAPCPYCRQGLDPDSRIRVAKYRYLLDGALNAAVASERADLKLQAETVTRLNLETIGEQIRRLTEGENAPAFVASAAQAIADCIGLQRTVLASETVQPIPNMDELLAQLEAAEVALEKRVKSLTTNTAASRTSIDEKKRKARDLADRIRLAEVLPQVESFVRSASKAKRLQVLADGISSGVLRASTALSKQVSTDVVNSRFAALFSEECDLLRAPDVSLEFVGRAGQAERKKVVASYRPSQILSEGEQKVLAIADFLAECRLRGAKAPIVFDDPVSSLDYRRLDEVADRVTALSKTHQVIVFTHNISFAIALLERRSGKKERCAFYEVREDGTKKGVLGADIEPQLDSPDVIGKKIVEALDQAEETDELALEDVLVLKAAALMRSWLETFVEQDLFASVTQRYRSNVRLGSVRNVRVDRLEAAFDLVDKGFAITSGVIEGHSHADEQKNTKKTRKEIADLWAEMQTARKLYKE